MSKPEKMNPSSVLEKMSTGIAGFDEITRGGLPRGRVTLVVGGPGTGKTVFALQTLVNGAWQRREPGIFVAFEENARHIVANAASFGWDLPALAKETLFFLDARISPDIVKAGEFDLAGMLASITAKADAMRAKRIVFDSIDVLLLLLDDPRTEQREVYRLHDWLLQSGLTGIITAKTEGTDPFVLHRQGFMQFMADCMIVLHHHLTDRVSLRGLRVVKYRGSIFAENEFPLTIGPSGMEVAGIGSTELDYKVSTERVSTGIPRLDTALSGGYYRGTSVLISGSAGTAKSTLAGAFAEAACRRGERVLFVGFDEAGSEIVRNLASVGIRLGPHLKSGLLRMYSARIETKSAEEHVMMLKALSREHQPRCLVIDPLSALAQVGGPSTALGVAQRLLRLTKTEGITVVCTCQIQTVDPQGETPVLDVSSIVDTWIHLSYVPHGGERNRALTIVKSRGTKHSNQVRELLIRDKGVTLADVYTAEGRVLMGTARWAKEASERTESERIRMEVEGKRRELLGAEAKVKAQLEAFKHELEARQAELALLVSEQQGREDQETQRTSELRRLRDADKNLPGDAPTKARTKKASRARDSQKDQGGA